MRPIATDTHDFPSLRRDGKIYVDKTEFIYRQHGPLLRCVEVGIDFDVVLW